MEEEVKGPGLCAPVPGSGRTLAGASSVKITVSLSIAVDGMVHRPPTGLKHSFLNCWGLLTSQVTTVPSPQGCCLQRRSAFLPKVHPSLGAAPME